MEKEECQNCHQTREKMLKVTEPDGKELHFCDWDCVYDCLKECKDIIRKK